MTERLRRVTLQSAAGAVAAFGALALLFGVLLAPADGGSCTTGLRPGTYADWLRPAHLAAFVLLAALIVRLELTLGGGRLPRQALYGLGAATGFLAAALAWHPLMDWLGVTTFVAAMPLLVALAIAVVLHVVKARRMAPAERWPHLARFTRGVLWAGLLVFLPAHFTAAYFNGASLFCF